MGDKIAQTRFENVSKLSNESLLVRDNTLRCDEDSMKLNELMELCTTLQSRILALEKTKTTQALEITRLKMRVKKLEKKQRSRTHKLKRLYKHKHITNNINKPFDSFNNMLAALTQDNLHGKEVFVDKDDADKEVNVAGELNASSIATTDSVAVTITTEEVNLAKALTELKALKPKKRRKFFAVKRDKEKRNKPPTQAQQRKIMCIYLKNMEGKKLKDLKNKYFDSIQKMFDKAFNRQKVDDDKETTELKKLMEIIPNEEEVAIDAIPLAVKSLKIVDWKIHKEEKKSYYQILRADENSKMYTVFNIILKEFDREDLEDLYRLVKAKYGSTRPVEDLDLILWATIPLSSSSFEKLNMLTSSKAGMFGSNRSSLSSFVPAAFTVELTVLIFTNGTVNTAQAVNTAHGVSTASTQVNAAFSTNIDNLLDAVIYSCFGSQPSSSQLIHKDLKQIYLDDMEEIDLRWECGAPRNQDNKHKKSSRRSVPIETSNSTALVSCASLGGYD
nr:hypothetical protein [Tanacetum cinerariifolium]